MAALTEVRVPDIGDYTDVPVIEVLVREGDTVAADDPLIVLESDKATMEVPSPSAGVVSQVSVTAGGTVSQGDLILTLIPSGDALEPLPDVPAAPQPAPAPAAAPPPPPAPEPAAEEDAAPLPPRLPSPAPAPAPTPRRRATDPPPPPVYASPSVRRTARELGVDLSTVAGTGPKGRITREDVERAGGGAPAPAPIPAPVAPVAPQAAPQQAPAPAASPARPAAAAPAVPAGLPAWPAVDHAAFGPVDTLELTRIQRLSGPALARNWVTIPHVTQFDQADITDLEAFRKEVNAAHADRGVKVTMVSLLLKACAVALREFPAFNSSLEGDRLVLKRYFHLGFAADTPNGLVVPVIRDVDRKGLLGIAAELAELSAAARDGKLTREQMQGGTFTISSLGGIGGTAFTPIINAPEVAILGVSRSATAPVWDGAEFRPRLMLPLSLSYDHRVIDGAAAARFTTRLCALLTDPRQMLL